MKPTEEQTYRQGIMDRFDNVDKGIATIDNKVTYTNGKVRKIIMALILLAGIVIGQSFTNTHDIISLLLGAFH